jgi:GGDEF domain-containing protein
MSMLIALTVAERESVRSRFGPEASEQLCRAVAAAFTAELADSWVLTIDEDQVLVVVPGEVRGAEQRLGRARAAVASHRFTLGAEQITVTPLVGFSAVPHGDFRKAHTRAIHALESPSAEWTWCRFAGCRQLSQLSAEVSVHRVRRSAAESAFSCRSF